MKYLIVKILFISGLNKAFLNFFRMPRVFLYHGVVKHEARRGISNYRQKHILLRSFEKQIEFICSNFKVVGLNDFAETLKNSPDKARGMAVITFDDGYKNIFDNAWPVLKKYNVPFAVFLPTDFIDKHEPLWVDRLESAINDSIVSSFCIKKGSDKVYYDISTEDNKMRADSEIRDYIKSLPDIERKTVVNEIAHQCVSDFRENIGNSEVYAPINWGEMKDMIGSGLVTVGSHTKSHAIASRISKDEFKRELDESKKIIEKNLGVGCEWFAYPNGKKKDFSTDLSEIIKQSGFKGSLSTEMEFCDNGFDLFAIPRIALDETNNMSEFLFAVSGIRMFLRRLRDSLNMFVKNSMRIFSDSDSWKEKDSITYFHDTAQEYEDSYGRDTPRGYSFRIRKKLIMEAFRDFPKGAKVLDIGCGPAVYTCDLVDCGFEVWGVDPAEDMINIANSRFSKNEKVHFSVGKVQNLAFPDKFFDGVIAAGLFEYLDDINASMKEVNRVLSLGGLFVSSYPYFWSVPRIWDRAITGVLGRVKKSIVRGKPKMNSREFKVNNTSKMMENLGFKVKNVKFYNARILWTPFDRLFPKLSSKISGACEKLAPSCLKTGFIVYASRK